jgi:hypothetical protein
MKKNKPQSRKSRRRRSKNGFWSKNLFDFFDLAVKILISCRDDDQNDFICAGPDPSADCPQIVLDKASR